MGFELMEARGTGAAGMMAYSAASPPSRPAPAPKTKMLYSNASVAAERERSEKLLQSQFKPVDLTKEMAETYYYGRQDFKASGDDDANLFWLDLVQWDESKGGSFLSQVKK